MIVRLTCPICHGSGTINNPPAFYDEGKAPEESVNCHSCKGTGYIVEHNAFGIRATVLLARNIQSSYPQFHSWEEIYRVIVVNISNAFNVSITSALWNKQNTKDFTFEDDSVFSEDEMEIDSYLEIMIKNGNYIEAAKAILGIKDNK